MPNPVLAQWLNNEGYNPPTTQVPSIQPFLTTTFPSAVSTGSARVVFYTVSDFAGIHTDLAASDTQSNGYIRLAQANTIQSGGAQSVAVLLAVNAAAGAAPTVKTYLSTNGDTEDYQANVICEVTNVATSPLVGYNSNAQNALASGTNNITSGTITVSALQVPCLMLAMSMNTSASAGSQTPAVGTGMTNVNNALWGFHTAGITATLATQLITSAGSYAAIFSAPVTGDYATVAVILQGASLGVPVAWLI